MSKPVQLLAVAAVGGAGYYIYQTQYAQPKLVTTSANYSAAENLGRQIDNKASETVNFIDKKASSLGSSLDNAAKNARSSAQEAGASIVDQTSKAVDNAHSGSQSLLSKAKGWITGSK